MEVFTTISPKGDMLRQSIALKSWTKQGNVNSVNTSEEISLLESTFPFVNFIESNDTLNIDGKKLITIRSLFNAINEHTKENFILINSDLSLSDSFDLDKFNVSSNEIFIGNRTEFTYDFNIDDYVIGEKYFGGYDIFVMSNEILNLLLSVEQPYDFAFGVPWWDYWVPFILLENNIKLISSNDNIIMHETHKTNYSHKIYEEIGREFLKYYNKIYPGAYGNVIFNFSKGLNDNLISKNIIYK